MRVPFLPLSLFSFSPFSLSLSLSHTHMHTQAQMGYSRHRCITHELDAHLTETFPLTFLTATVSHMVNGTLLPLHLLLSLALAHLLYLIRVLSYFYYLWLSLPPPTFWLPSFSPFPPSLSCYVQFSDNNMTPYVSHICVMHFLCMINMCILMHIACSLHTRAQRI